MIDVSAVHPFMGEEGWTFDEGDPEIVQDAITMSELDEINPPDAISYNVKFFEAAREFISEVECTSNLPKKGRAFNEDL